MAQKRRTTKRKTISRKKSTPRKRSPRKNGSDISFTQMLIIAFIFSIPLFFLRSDISSSVFNICACAKIGNDNGGGIVYDAINYNHKIYRHETYEEKLKALLAEEVIWFDNRDKAKFRNKNNIDFSGSLYNDFCFYETPINHSSAEEIRRGDYDLNFIGIYKYKKPEEQLFKIEGGRVKVENGLIKSITTYNEEVPYKNWINHFYSYYWGIIYIFVFAIVFVVLKTSERVQNIFLNVFGKLINFK